MLAALVLVGFSAIAAEGYADVETIDNLASENAASMEEFSEENDTVNWFMCFPVILALVVVYFIIKASPHYKNQATVKSTKPFYDSVWTMLYSWAGGISLVAVFIGLISKQWEFALGFLFFASSCFFAAHLLRVQERTAHYSEQTANHSEQQTKLLEKILEERLKANPKKKEE